MSLVYNPVTLRITEMISRIQQRATPLGAIFGSFKVRRMPPMNFEVACYPGQMLTTLEFLKGELVFRQRVPIPGRGKFEARKEEAWDSELGINANALMAEFFKVKSPEQALNLLSEAGDFRHIRGEADWLESIISWSDFQLWQELVKIVLTENHLHLGVFESPTQDMFVWGPGKDGTGGVARMLPDAQKRLILTAAKPTFDWLRGIPSEVMFSSLPDPKDPKCRPVVSAGVITDNVIDAILACVFVDTLNADFQKCGLEDCPNIFEVTSDHGKEYCDHACAHKAGMRRRRKNLKHDREKAKALEPRKDEESE